MTVSDLNIFMAGVITGIILSFLFLTGLGALIWKLGNKNDNESENDNEWT